MARPKLGQGPAIILSGATATGQGAVYDVSNYDHIVVALYTKTNASCTIKFAGSMELIAPTFTSAQSTTNIYDFIDAIPFTGSATPIVGATGIVLSGTDKIALYTIDVSYVKWFTAVITAYSAGNISVNLSCANNYTIG